LTNCTDFVHSFLMTDHVNISLPIELVQLLVKVQEGNETISDALNRVLEKSLKPSEKDSGDG
jgi:hypothetical protein